MSAEFVTGRAWPVCYSCPMPSLNREEIQRRGKQAQRGLAFTSYSSMGLPFVWFYAGVLVTMSLRDIRPNVATAVILLTIWWLLLPFAFVLPWRLWKRRAKRVAVCCPSCGEPLLGSRAEMLFTTGRCFGCGTRIEVEGECAEVSTPRASAAKVKLIPRSQLAGRSLSRAAQRVIIVAGLCCYLPFVLLIFGAIKDGRWLGAGFAAMITGIIASLVIGHFHEKKQGGTPPKCPGCGLQLRPYADKYVLLTGHCGNCGNKITEPPTELPDGAKAPFTRSQLAEAHKRLSRLTGRLLALASVSFWTGLAVAFWLMVFIGRGIGEAMLTTLLASFFIVFPALGWFLEFRIPKISRFNCPVCRESLLGKPTTASIVTGRCWNCTAKIFDDAE